VTPPWRVAVDPEKCESYGVCVAIQPDVFELVAESPPVVLLREVVDSDDLEDVEEAARACPTQAISLHPADPE
jgi:ferredoxin